MTPSNAVGYCAVVMPSLDHWQGYFIIDDEALRQQAVMLQMAGLVNAGQANPYGSLQAALVEGALTDNQTAVGAAALALRGIDKNDFFYIVATKEPEGTRTQLHRLNATSIEEAKAEIDSLPEVQAIKTRLLAKLSAGREGGHRRRAFH